MPKEERLHKMEAQKHHAHHQAQNRSLQKVAFMATAHLQPQTHRLNYGTR